MGDMIKHAECGTTTGCYTSLVNRLRGIYTMPVDDGAGPLNGSGTFTRRFEGLPPINEEAAKAIEHLSEMLAEVYSQCGNHRPETTQMSAPRALHYYRAGNMEGRYFTQWRVDLLVELLGIIRERGFAAEDAEIWYDEPSDFHYLSFIAGGNVFAVRFYKVFSMSVNGVDDWTGVLRSRINQLANHIVELAR